MSVAAHDSRPGILPDEVLPLPEFMFRARLSKVSWLVLNAQAEKHGHEICYRIGTKVYVRTTEFFDFLNFATKKKLPLTSGRTLPDHSVID